MKSMVRGRIFQRHPIVFWAVEGALLVFFAIAAVHEIIPGLCLAEEDDDSACPFCKLVHALALLVFLAAFLSSTRADGRAAGFFTALCLKRFHHFAWRERAPPVG